MKRIYSLILLLMCINFYSRADVTLDYCLERAEANYPTIKKYALVENLTTLNLSEINRGWLPSIGLSAQGNIQNVVPAFSKCS